MALPDFVGRPVGNWRLLRKLGEGAFGGVFEAEHSGIAGKHAAVKVLHPELTVNQGIKQRFLNEASAASRAEHENIVQIFDGGITPDGLCYSVMELLRGQTLTNLLRQGRLSETRTINIGVQIAGALEAAHGLGIVHRDLKPDNIFIVPRAANPEFVKVLDFGVAKLRGEAQPDQRLTSTGMIVGTSAYMAPEQWNAEPDIDGRADVYALGVILYQCLSGRLPFKADSLIGWARAHLETPPPPLEEAGVPAALSRVVRQMLGKRRDQRLQSMQQVVRELHAAERRLRTAHSAPAAMPAGPDAPTAVVDRRGPEPVGAAPPVAAAVGVAPAPSYPPAASVYPSAPGGPYPVSQPGPFPAPAPGLFQRLRQDPQLLSKFGSTALVVVIVVVYLIFNWDQFVTSIKDSFRLR